MKKLLSSISILSALFFIFTPQITFALSESQQVDSILQAEITTGFQLDNLWMGYFASKDLRFVEKIISVYEDAANDPQIDENDIILLVKSTISSEFRQRHDAQLKSLPSKYPDRACLNKVVVASAALWALESNARQCPLVDKTIKKHKVVSLKIKEATKI